MNPVVSFGRGSGHAGNVGNDQGFSPWFPEEAIVLRPTFAEPWFHAIGPVGHSVLGNGIQQLLVEPAEAFGITLSLHRDHRLERLERLDRPLETERSRLEAVFAGGLCDNSADQVVSQNMCPEFFPDRFWCLAA